MNKIDLLLELLDRWDDAPPQSKPAPEDVCREAPELLEEFRQLLLQRGAIIATLDGTNSPVQQPESIVQNLQSGRYSVVHFHDAGGLGWVYLANDRELGRTVALKCMQPGPASDPSARERFFREAHITARLEHPGVVPIYALGGLPEDKYPSYAMRFIEGESLRSAIRRFHEGALPNWSSMEAKRMLRSFIDVCQTVAYAHSRGVIHRDLKSANIMLGPFGETLVLDWGLAKLAGDESIANQHHGDEPIDSADQSVSGLVIGTIGFMSPEQAISDGIKVGRPSDIFSLGAIHFQILTGQPPYTGDQALDSARNCQYAMPRALQSSIPKPLEAICLRAMRREPADRYRSAIELKEDVERFLADEPVSAQSESIMERSGRFVRKNRTLIKSVTSMGIATIAMLAYLVLITTQKNRELVQANQQVRLAKDDAVLQRDRAQSERIHTEHEFYRARMSLLSRAFSERKPKLLAELVQSSQPTLNQPVDTRGQEWWIAWWESFGNRQQLPISDVAVVMQKLVDHGRKVVSLDAAGRFRVIEAAKGKELLSHQTTNPMFATLHIAEPDDLPCSNDGSVVAIPRGVFIDIFQLTAAGYHLEKSLESNTGVEVWDGFTQPSTDQQAAYISIAVAGNGSKVVARDALGQVQLWDIKTGISKSLPLTDEHDIHHLRLSENGDFLAYVADGDVHVKNLETDRMISTEPGLDLMFQGLTFGQYGTVVGWTNNLTLTFALDFPTQLTELWRVKLLDSPASEAATGVSIPQFVREWIELEPPNVPLPGNRLRVGDGTTKVRSSWLAVIRPSRSRLLLREPAGSYPWSYPVHTRNSQPDRITELNQPSIPELADVSTEGKIGLLKHAQEHSSTISTVEFMKACLDTMKNRGPIQEIAWSNQGELISLSKPTEKPSILQPGSMDIDPAELDIRTRPFHGNSSDHHETLSEINCLAVNGSVVAQLTDSLLNIRLLEHGQRFNIDANVIKLPTSDCALHLVAWNRMNPGKQSDPKSDFEQVLGEKPSTNASKAARSLSLPWILVWNNRMPAPPQDEIQKDSSAAKIQIVDYELRELIAEVEVYRSYLTSVIISSDGRYIAALSESGSVRTWQVNSEREIVNGPEYSLSDQATCLTFSNDGQQLAVGLQNGDLIVFHRENLNISQFKAHESSVVRVCFSEDDGRLVSVGEDQTLTIFDADVWAEVFRSKLVAQPTCLALDSKTGMIAVGNVLGHVEILVAGNPNDLLTAAYHWLQISQFEEFSKDTIVRELWAEYIGAGRAEHSLQVGRGVLDALRKRVANIPLEQLRSEFIRGFPPGTDYFDGSDAFAAGRAGLKE